MPHQARGADIPPAKTCLMIAVAVFRMTGHSLSASVSIHAAGRSFASNLAAYSAPSQPCGAVRWTGKGSPFPRVVTQCWRELSALTGASSVPCGSTAFVSMPITFVGQKHCLCSKGRKRRRTDKALGSMVVPPGTAFLLGQAAIHADAVRQWLKEQRSGHDYERGPYVVTEHRATVHTRRKVSNHSLGFQ